MKATRIMKPIPLLPRTLACLCFALVAAAPSLHADASNPRPNNEKPEKVTGQVKRIHPHALKLILNGKTDEALAYLEAAETSKINPDHTQLLRDIAQGKDGAWQYDADTWPWERTLPDTSLKKDAPTDRFTIAFGGGAGFVPENERMWTTIGAIEPRALLLLGDNVYIDDPETPEMQRFHYYRRQSQPEWSALAKQVPIYSIWDDHDFTTNDGWGGPDIETPAWKREVWNVFRGKLGQPLLRRRRRKPGLLVRLPRRRRAFHPPRRPLLPRVAEERRPVDARPGADGVAEKHAEGGRVRF